MKPNEVSQIRARLKDSLDAAQLRYGCWLLLFAYGAALAAAALTSRREIALPVTAVVMGLGIGACLVRILLELLAILREPEGYVFCRAELGQPRHEPMTRGNFSFSAVIETEREGRFLVETKPIFLSHGFGGPLMEDYLGKTVTLAWNRETGSVVVIE